jgi:hypothetical protein
MNVIYLVDPAGALFGPVTFPVVPGIGPQVPENTLTLRLPLDAAPDGYVWALVDDKPALRLDHRGVVYSTATGAAEQFTVLGELPEGLTREPRPSATHAWIDGSWQVSAELVATKHATEQARAWLAIKDERDRRSIAGVKVGTLWVHSDLFSRNQWLGLKDDARDVLAAGGAMTDTLIDDEGQAINWKTLGGTFVTVTAQLAFDVVAAVKCSDIAIFTVAEQHNAAMRAAEVPTDYDFTAYWPQSYAEWAEVGAQ